MPGEVPAEVVVEFDRVSLQFEEKVVLREVSFKLERGETKVILGVSGAGKSVLLKLTMGLLQPDSGKIFVNSTEISTLKESQLAAVRKNIGMVFQESALFDSLTVGENVAFVFNHSNIAASVVEQKAREALRFVELEHTFDMMPAELSGGMRRRVAIARAAVAQPPLMLYDSPTAGLDPITATRIMTLIVKQRDVSNVSSLLVTHRLQDAFIMATTYFDPQTEKLLPAKHDGMKQETHTRFLMLRDGNILFHGKLDDLLANHDPYVQKYLE